MSKRKRFTPQRFGHSPDPWVGYDELPEECWEGKGAFFNKARICLNFLSDSEQEVLLSECMGVYYSCFINTARTVPLASETYDNLINLNDKLKAVIPLLEDLAGWHEEPNLAQSNYRMIASTYLDRPLSNGVVGSLNHSIEVLHRLKMASDIGTQRTTSSESGGKINNQFFVFGISKAWQKITGKEPVLGSYRYTDDEFTTEYVEFCWQLFETFKLPKTSSKESFLRSMRRWSGQFGEIENRSVFAFR